MHQSIYCDVIYLNQDLKLFGVQETLSVKSDEH